MVGGLVAKPAQPAHGSLRKKGWGKGRFCYSNPSERMTWVMIASFAGVNFERVHGCMSHWWGGRVSKAPSQSMVSILFERLSPKSWLRLPMVWPWKHTIAS